MKRLAIYLMAGRQTPELAEAAVAGGADLVEIGFPFSDPLADGPVLRAAAERALAEGMRTEACLACVAAVRRRVHVPLVVMTYASVLEAYGYERFAADARLAGATSLILADLPLEQHPEIRRIQMVAPTTSEQRMRRAAEQTDGWLYLVSMTGTTGQTLRSSEQLAALVQRARRVATLPLLAGFGISTPREAAEAAALADGIVVGTRAVQIAQEEGSPLLCTYVRALRVAIDASTNRRRSMAPSR